LKEKRYKIYIKIGYTSYVRSALNAIIKFTLTIHMCLHVPVNNDFLKICNGLFIT